MTDYAFEASTNRVIYIFARWQSWMCRLAAQYNGIRTVQTQLTVCEYRFDSKVIFAFIIALPVDSNKLTFLNF